MKGCKLRPCALCRERVRLQDRALCGLCNACAGWTDRLDAPTFDNIVEWAAKRALEYERRRVRGRK